ncbi:hypothetical protein RUMGNA_00313 [Mediterraneibacter gnavus ATCC 29149]|uniref:Uncharacterized protein n=1 Tax=Mediterraneibacter gnavus (strain ATCC 29149 / DSM 114966 / JCM 6515 / VPI C7-9) TaxID=411470 RepID=A7AYE8_MEDG7|nr:hypothetical protein RUMGNA_00313 [Mediterraneibacter gnavus ATCC 29149]
MNKREFYNHKRSFLFLICFNQIEISNWRIKSPKLL